MKKRPSRIEKKVRRKKIGLMFVILLLLSSVFFILFTQTNFFHVSKIDINSNEILTDKEIILASGLIEGENIFMIDISLMEENLNAHPYIKQANVKRHFPNKISVDIDERAEFLKLSYIGSYIYLDDESIILSISLDKKNEKIPEIIGLNVKNAVVGDKIVLEEDGTETTIINQIINFLNLCKIIDLYDNITKVDIDDNFDITFQLKLGTKVAFGDLDNVKYKLSYLVEILDKIGNRMDLSDEDISNGLIDFSQGEDAIFTFSNN